MKPRRSHAPFHEADAALGETLEVLDVNVPNYNEWLRSLVEPAATGRVLEVGAGLGTFTSLLLQTADHVVAVEPSERASAVLRQTTAGDPRVTPVQGFALDAKDYGPFDGAVLSNVLEHIEDDVSTLAELRSLVRPGGAVAVFSPAFQCLMSDFDRSIGHVRRYRKRDLCRRFERAGLRVVDARYVNMPGFVAWLLVTRIFHRRPTHPHLSRAYDRTVVRAARAVEARVRPPFGQSVLVIGQVPSPGR